MSYEDQFRATCDAEGLAPAWAIKQIFQEHSTDLPGFQACHEHDWQFGETILEYLGY